MLTTATFTLRRGPKAEAIARLLLAQVLKLLCTPGWVYYEVIGKEYTSTRVHTLLPYKFRARHYFPLPA